MANILILFLLSIIHFCYGNKEQVFDIMCSDLIKSQTTLKNMNPSDCKLSFKNEHVTCTVRLMSESVPFNVTTVADTDYSSLVRVNLNYSFKFRVVGGDENGDLRRRCLVLTGVSFRRVTSVGEKRSKVLLPSRLFHLAANSALLGADSEVDEGVPAGVITLSADCVNNNLSSRSPGEGGSSSCVREVGVALPEAAAQLDLALLAFNYSFSGAGFPDRSGRGKSVARSLPAERLQRLQLRGGTAPDIEPPALGAQATELDLSYTTGHNLSTWEPQTDGLQRVSLSHAGLRSVPDFVSKQSALRGLALDGNSALVRAGGSAALRESLAGLNELQDLQLAGVRTDALTADTLPPLPSLMSLNMSGCGLRQIKGDALVGVPALQKLDLSDNFLTKVPGELATPCPRLRHLNLSRNKLLRGPRLRVSLLHELDLSRNALQSADEILVEGHVVTLLMAHNIVRSLEGSRFSNWAERVDISYNHINSLPLRVTRRDLEGLVALDLRGNRLDCSSCSIIELQIWLNESSVLVTPQAMVLTCDGGDSRDEDESSQRVMDISLPDCAPSIDYALLVAAPIVAVIALSAALIALVCLRRAGWLGVCGDEDEESA